MYNNLAAGSAPSPKLYPHFLLRLHPIPAQVLCVYNNSAAARTPLALALTVDDARTWDPLAVIEADPKGEGPSSLSPCFPL